MSLGRLIKMAVRSVWANKMRSFLTMLGIIIGISSVIVLVGLGEGTKIQVQSQIEQLGTNLITINLRGRGSVSISNSEIEELKTRPGISEIAPSISQGNVNVKAGTKTYTTSLEASTPEYAQIRKLGVSSGRFLSPIDIENRNQIVIIGIDVANELYSRTNVVGETINVNGVDFTIVGVLESQGSSTSGSGDDRIIIPISTAQRLLKNTEIRTFYVEAASKDDVDKAKGYLQLFLNKKFNNNTDSYSIFDQTSLLTTVNSTTNSMTMMLSGIAAISLLVGGIGIMNIMLVSVVERTKEIGIRKAVGAKRRVILSQFLIESAGISCFGGILGVLLGYLLAYIIKSAASMSVVISWNVVVEAVAFSVIEGIIFGMYPASKASKLNPIDALRFE